MFSLRKGSPDRISSFRNLIIASCIASRKLVSLDVRFTWQQSAMSIRTKATNERARPVEQERGTWIAAMADTIQPTSPTIVGDVTRLSSSVSDQPYGDQRLLAGSFCSSEERASTCYRAGGDVRTTVSWRHLSNLLTADQHQATVDTGTSTVNSTSFLTIRDEQLQRRSISFLDLDHSPSATFTPMHSGESAQNQVSEYNMIGEGGIEVQIEDLSLELEGSDIEQTTNTTMTDQAKDTGVHMLLAQAATRIEEMQKGTVFVYVCSTMMPKAGLTYFVNAALRYYEQACVDASVDCEHWKAEYIKSEQARHVADRESDRLKTRIHILEEHLRITDKPPQVKVPYVVAVTRTGTIQRRVDAAFGMPSKVKRTFDVASANCHRETCQPSNSGSTTPTLDQPTIAHPFYQRRRSSSCHAFFTLQATSKRQREGNEAELSEPKKSQIANWLATAHNEIGRQYFHRDDDRQIRVEGPSEELSVNDRVCISADDGTHFRHPFSFSSSAPSLAIPEMSRTDIHQIMHKGPLRTESTFISSRTGACAHTLTAASNAPDGSLHGGRRTTTCAKFPLHNPSTIRNAGKAAAYVQAMETTSNCVLHVDGPLSDCNSCTHSQEQSPKPHPFAVLSPTEKRRQLPD